MSWEESRTSALLEALGQAVSRTRYVVVAINISTALAAIAVLNGRVPWIRNTLERYERMCDITRVPSTSECQIASMLREILWKDFYTITIPVLGIKISTADMSERRKNLTAVE